MHQISENLKNNLNLLKIIYGTKNNRLQKQLLKDFSKNKTFYKSLQEIALNLGYNNIHVNKSQKTKLSKYKKLVACLCKYQNNKKKKQKLIVQSGGFLNLVIPILLSSLGTLALEKFNDATQ